MPCRVFNKMDGITQFWRLLSFLHIIQFQSYASAYLAYLLTAVRWNHLQTHTRTFSSPTQWAALTESSPSFRGESWKIKIAHHLFLILPLTPCLPDSNLFFLSFCSPSGSNSIKCNNNVVIQRTSFSSANNFHFKNHLCAPKFSKASISRQGRQTSNLKL